MALPPDWCSRHSIVAYYSFTDHGGMKGCWFVDLYRMVPHKWSPVRYRSSTGQWKLAGHRPTFYHHATQPTIETREMCGHIDMQTHSGRLELGFDLRVSACQGPAMDYMSTDFGADSASHFPFRAQTWLNALPNAGGYTTGVGNKRLFTC